jgi:hypothetical protein
MRRIRRANTAHLFKTRLAKTAHVVFAKTAHLLLAKTAHLLGHAPFLRMCEYGASFGIFQDDFWAKKRCGLFALNNAPENGASFMERIPRIFLQNRKKRCQKWFNFQNTLLTKPLIKRVFFPRIFTASFDMRSFRGKRCAEFGAKRCAFFPLLKKVALRGGTQERHAPFSQGEFCASFLRQLL